MYIIRSFHSNRLHFWQVPWATNKTGTWKMLGGWVPYSNYATKYENLGDCEMVAVTRAMGGRVEEYKPRADHG